VRWERLSSSPNLRKARQEVTMTATAKVRLREVEKGTAVGGTVRLAIR
jgi:hypothetical protein